MLTPEANLSPQNFKQLTPFQPESSQPKSFQLDPFQLEAIASIDSGHNVLVSAPTGAGKTVVADHAVDRALALGRRAVYTTPVKALSNQKHRDLAARLGSDQVGLLTGDRRINPSAPVVVMTTEVLRALFYERSSGSHSDPFSNLEVVVLDEAHFITDPERGPAWEEVVIHAPHSTRVVALSATLDDPEMVASWLRSVRGPTDLVVGGVRPVPLRHVYAIGRLDNSPPLLLPVEVDGAPNPTAIALDGPRVRETRGEGLQTRFRSRARAVPPQRRLLLDELIRDDMAPVIWFVLSRRGCESIARTLLESGGQLTTVERAAELRRRAEELAASLPTEDLRSVDLGGWSTRLAAGIGTHHGGLLPAQRELVERAFQEGLLEAVVATETLALGVNLPARSVIIDRVRRSEEGNGLMKASDFAQLAGRAGRRGLDNKGTVVVPWADDASFLEVASLVVPTGRPVRSWFSPTPVMVANLRRAGDPTIDRALSNSLAGFLRARRAGHLQEELDRLDAELAALAAHSCDLCAGPAAVVAAPAAPVRLAGIALAELRRGDVVIDPGRSAALPSVVVAQARKRRGAIAVDTVLPDGRRTVLTDRDLRLPPVVLARVDLGEWLPTERGHAQQAVDALAALDLASAVQRARAGAPPPTSTKGPGCSGARRPRLRATRNRTAEQIAELTDGDRPEFDAIERVLNRLDHVAMGKLTPRGERLRRLFIPSGPCLAEWLADGGHAGLDPAELAAALSWFTPVSSSRLESPAEPHASIRLGEAWRAAGRAHERVEMAAIAEDIDAGPGPDRSIAAVIHRWCAGGSLHQALGRTGVSPGDLGREVRQIAELLDQVRRAEPALTADVEVAQHLLTRGAFADRG